MLSDLLTALAIALPLGACAALVAQWRGRASLALGLNGVTLAVLGAGTGLAIAANPDARVGPAGLTALAALAGVAGWCGLAARQPARRDGLFWSCWALSAAAAGCLVYLRWGFRPF